MSGKKKAPTRVDKLLDELIGESAQLKAYQLLRETCFIMDWI